MGLPRFRVTERQVLLLLLGVSLFGYIAAFFWGNFWSGAEQKLSPGGSARVRWLRPATASNPGDKRLLLATVFDPSLSALPNPQGFSGNAWKRLAPPVYEEFQPAYPPQYLAAPAPGVLPELLPRAELPVVVGDGIERPIVDGGDDESLPATAVIPVTNTAVRFEGALADRRVLQEPVWPLAPANPATRRLRVWLAVSPDGRVRHATVARGSLNEALDQQALEAVRQLMFEPVAATDPVSVTWGGARFLWATRN